MAMRTLFSGILALAFTAVSVEATAAVWEKCAGHNFDTKACAEGSSCIYENYWYSQCKPDNRCSAVWKQCGGHSWWGTTSCCSGSTCVYENYWYSQCKPTAPTYCSSLWGQCGGEGWKGATCCYGDAVCIPQPGNKWYSQCLPKPPTNTCAKLWGQCGGDGWKGSTCCEKGSVCIPQANNRWYSQCLPAGSPTPTPSPPTCSPLWGQCGGLEWKGAKCCEAPYDCVPQKNNPWYSQCLPPSPTPAPTPADSTPAPPKNVCSPLWGQCGGLLWTGATCCEANTKCIPQLNNPWYSQCLPDSSVARHDYTISFIVVGETTATLSAADKISLRHAVAVAAGVPIEQVFLVSVEDGVGSPARKSRDLMAAASLTATLLAQSAPYKPTLAKVQAATTLDLLAACTASLKPDPSGVCVCPATMLPPVAGSCTYG